MKYIFKQIDDISGSNAVMTIEFNADTIYDVLEQFQFFLRGSGFQTSGTLDFVNHDDVEESTEEHYEDEENYLSKPQQSWPFPIKRPDSNKESWPGVAPAVSSQYAVKINAD